MEIKRKTPRTEMVYWSIITKMTRFHKELADELGIDITSVDGALARFAALCARATFDVGEVDFALASIEDDHDEVRAKFTKYLDTKNFDKVEAVMNKSARMDLPVDDALGPKEPTEKNS